MSETLMRQWHMLRLVPRYPSKISTMELMHRLADEGFNIHQRSIQRDLMTLSEVYPLQCDEESKPFGWSWMSGAHVMDIPGMDSHAALAFHLAKEHLEPLLPTATVRHLEPHFKTAAHVLDGIKSKRGVPAWADKVRVVHRGPKLKAPEIKSEVQEQVYEALLHNRKLQILYSPRSEEGTKEYEDVNPLGLVLKEGVFYLVCCLWDYKNPLLLTLHRMLEATALDAPCGIPDGFDLDEYIASGELDFAVGGKIKLKTIFSKNTAFHLNERPLSDDQKIEEQSDNQFLVTATVQDTSELRWWLLGFGDQVEVLQPAKLRKEIADIMQSAANIYSMK